MRAFGNLAKENNMKMKYCDVCGTRTDYSYSVIFTCGSGSDYDDTFELCPRCWNDIQKMFQDQRKLNEKIVSKSSHNID